MNRSGEGIDLACERRIGEQQTRALVTEFGPDECAGGGTLGGRFLVEINVLQCGKIVPSGSDPGVESITGNEQQSRTRIIEDEAALLRGQSRIDRDMHRAELEHREVDDIPLGPVGLGDIGDAVAGADPGSVQPGGESTGSFDDLAGRETFPSAADLVRERIGFRKARELVHDEVKNARGLGQHPGGFRAADGFHCGVSGGQGGGHQHGEGKVRPCNGRSLPR